MKEFAFSSEVDFSDTDAGGFAHFTSVLRWVERAEAAWMKSIGVMSFEVLDDGGYRGFPRVGVRCDYKVPMPPAESFTIILTPGKIGKTSFSYSFKVLKGGAPDKIAAEGEITVVYVLAQRCGDFEKQPLPPQFSKLS